MARCCGGAECSCVIMPGDNTSVTGVGTNDDPYIITSDFDSQVALQDHIDDPTGAHAATAISYAGSAGLSAVNVEAALDELDTEKAPLDSPAFTNNPSAPTAGTGDSDTTLANTAFVQQEIAAKTTNVMLTATQSNNTVTPAVLTGHTFTIPPGKTLRLAGLMIFQAANTTTGGAYGVRVTQPTGASGPAQGSVALDVAVNEVASAAGLRLGDNFNVAANTNALVEIVGTAVGTINTDHVAQCYALIKNTAAGHSTTVTVEFRSEVAASAVTAQIGTAAQGHISS